MAAADERTALSAATSDDATKPTGRGGGLGGLNARRLATLLMGVFAFFMVVVSVYSGGVRRAYLNRFGTWSEVSDQSKALLNCRDNRIQPTVYLLGGAPGDQLHQETLGVELN